MRDERTKTPILSQTADSCIIFLLHYPPSDLTDDYTLATPAWQDSSNPRSTLYYTRRPPTALLSPPCRSLMHAQPPRSTLPSNNVSFIPHCTTLQRRRRYASLAASFLAYAHHITAVTQPALVSLSPDPGARELCCRAYERDDHEHSALISRPKTIRSNSRSTRLSECCPLFT